MLQFLPGRKRHPIRCKAAKQVSLVFFKSAPYASVRVVPPSILLVLLALNTGAAAQQSTAQQASTMQSGAQPKPVAHKRPAKAAKKPVPDPPLPPAPPPPPP